MASKDSYGTGSQSKSPSSAVFSGRGTKAQTTKSAILQGQVAAQHWMSAHLVLTLALTLKLRRAHTRTRHASVFSMHSDTQAVPAFHCIRMFKGHFFDTHFFKMHRHAVYHCLKEVQKPFRHASVFKTLVSTRACPFRKRAFSPI